jgi:spore germination cell wall hydrolase CwlJ-like protein
MYWRLRRLWDRVDAGALAFTAIAAGVIGTLLATMFGVFEDRDARARRERELHARSIDCLARNVYFEARGEPLAGQYAVAEVTMNRRGRGLFRKTVCEVVYQPSAFSWTSQRSLPAPRGEPWNGARKVAEVVYWQRHTPIVPGARHYHATYVKPAWAKDMKPVARIGRHVFYP